MSAHSSRQERTESEKTSKEAEAVRTYAVYVKQNGYAAFIPKKLGLPTGWEVGTDDDYVVATLYGIRMARLKDDTFYDMATTLPLVVAMEMGRLSGYVVALRAEATSAK